MALKVAVIGSGIAGLSAAWALTKTNHVTLYERQAALGMDSHAIEIEGSTTRCRIDVPLRVVYEAYYPTLTNLYRQIGVALKPIEFSGSFSHLAGKTYLRYRNLRVGGLAIPWVTGGGSMTWASMTLAMEFLRYFREATRDLKRGRIGAITFDEYLADKRFSSRFIDELLLPILCDVCTCTYEAIRSYPAKVVVEYYSSRILLASMQRVANGTQEVVSKLRQGIADVRLNTPVQKVVRHADHVEIYDGNGDRETYQHVVMATQANQVLGMLVHPLEEETAALSAFAYERAHVVMHRDERLAPRDQRLWSPVNTIVSAQETMPMATLWMNAIYPELADEPPMFQTWNPLIVPRSERVIAQVSLERPIVTPRSLLAVQQLNRLHTDTDRRVWFCGSYAAPGIPLLESAASSGLRVAEMIDALSSRNGPERSDFLDIRVPGR